MCFDCEDDLMWFKLENLRMVIQDFSFVTQDVNLRMICSPINWKDASKGLYRFAVPSKIHFYLFSLINWKDARTRCMVIQDVRFL
jgi:hypothetical protein